jgi:hypothetical protein
MKLLFIVISRNQIWHKKNTGAQNSLNYDSLLIKSMNERHSWVTDVLSTCLDFPRLLWYIQINYGIAFASERHNTLSGAVRFQSTPSGLFQQVTHCIIQLSTRKSAKWFISIGFSDQNFVSTTDLRMLPSCCARFYVFNFITLIMTF